MTLISITRTAPGRFDLVVRGASRDARIAITEAQALGLAGEVTRLVEAEISGRVGCFLADHEATAPAVPVRLRRCLEEAWKNMVRAERSGAYVVEIRRLRA